jgi:hypothetical protein
MVPQLALAGALVLVAVAVLAFRNPTIINVVTTGFKGLIQASPSPTPQPFACTDRSGGTTGPSAQLTGIRVAHHSEAPGFDRIVFDFTGGVPSYDLTRQESAAFIDPPHTITLHGGAGLKVMFRDTDKTFTVGDMRPSLPAVQQIAQLTTDQLHSPIFGIGLSSPQCMRVLELSNPARLVVDILTSPYASPSATPTPLPTVSEATDQGPFTCQDRNGGTVTGSPMWLTKVRAAHQPAGYDRIVFEFAPPAGVTAFEPMYSIWRQASARFVKDPSGQNVTLRGSAGLRISFNGATGINSYTGAEIYTGPRDITPGLPVVQEVEQLGDFEGGMTWGAGLSRSSCIRTLELTNPTRLVIDVQTP